MSTDQPPPTKPKRRWDVTPLKLALVGGLAGLLVWLEGPELRQAARTGVIDRWRAGRGTLHYRDAPIQFVLRFAVGLVLASRMPILFAIMVVIYLRRRGEKTPRD
jgi:hypothetical protein